MTRFEFSTLDFVLQLFFFTKKLFLTKTTFKHHKNPQNKRFPFQKTSIFIIIRAHIHNPQHRHVVRTISPNIIKIFTPKTKEPHQTRSIDTNMTRLSPCVYVSNNDVHISFLHFVCQLDRSKLIFCRVSLA